MGTDMKTPRLFVRGENISDGCWQYCGGPSVAEATEVLMAALEEEIEFALQDCDKPRKIDIELKVVPMTDDEVENIPEM